jgi:colanic acid biosynthesis glycosyl transferase WcaI
LLNAHRTIALDRFMRDRLLAKGANDERVAVIPPWSHDDAVAYSARGREAFRAQHGLADKFVVMYSGNHSPCHPLDTLMAAALELKTRNDVDVAFCFVGGGSEQTKVREFAMQHELRSIKCLPYQPLNELSHSLSAADLHVVVMGDAFVGVVHPCKIYNIMAVGAPALYIGPDTSHITDLAHTNYPFFFARHGDGAAVVAHILEARRCERRPLHAFSKHTLLPELIAILEAEPKSEPYSFVREVSLP